MRQRFIELIGRFSLALSNGTLKNATEETIRTWINEMLAIFGWDVQNTNQILQERTLNRTQRDKLNSIGSKNTRPDYTFVNGNVPLAFLDAKSLSVSIETDSAISFQIRSYGWSIGASYSIVTNMKELSVYDCKPMPLITDTPSFARILHLQHEQYVENFDELKKYLDRDIVLIAEHHVNEAQTSVDAEFTKMLSDFRVKLIKGIIESNPEIKPQEAPLTLWAQIIINRILFIRVCESRGLEKEDLLKDYQSEGFWNKFKTSSYIDFFNKYDGPLFGRNVALNDLRICDTTFEEFLATLYYPSPYRFDVIPLKTLSDIYDRFLGYVVAIDVKNDITLTLKDEYRKSNGAVTTPLPIVDKTIETVISKEALASKTVDELLGLRFVDPACGSGAFLASIFDILASAIITKIEDGANVDKALYVCHKDRCYLTIKCKKAIIQHCIFGVDIDEEATEVAKMSLSLKVIDGYEQSVLEQAGILGPQILNGIGANIQCGNSLVTKDILGFDNSLFDRPQEIKRTHIFNWASAFPAIFEQGGFDYVIGNPPYVEVKNYNTALGTMAAWIKKTYKCAQKGKTDLSIPFIEKGVELLKQNGKLSFVVQKRFFKTEYGLAMRRFIRENNLLYSIHEYSDNDLFHGKTTYVAILSLAKRDAPSENFLYASSSAPAPKELPMSIINDAGWAFDNIPVLGLRSELSKRVGTLKDGFRIQVGIQVLWVKAYHIRAESIHNGIIKGSSSLDSNVTIEVDACRELICNEQIRPYSLPETKTFAIFPYDVCGQKVFPIPFTEYARRFPLAAKYLAKHKLVIVGTVETQPSRDKRLDMNEYWHIYTRTQSLDTEKPKVIIPMTTHFPVASLVKEAKVYCDNANINFIQSPQINDQAYALAGIINSRAFGVLARNTANPSRNNYSKYNKEFLNMAPFPNHIFSDGNQELRSIAELSMKIESLNTAQQSATPSEKDSVGYALASLWDRLDERVNAAYGLTQTEKNIITSQPYHER